MATKKRRKKKEKRTELIIGIGAIVLGIVGFAVFINLGEAGQILAIFWGCVLVISGIAVLAKDYSSHREYKLKKLQEKLKSKYDKLIADLPPRPAGSRFIDVDGEYTVDCWKREKTLHLITSWGYLQPTLIADSKRLFGKKKSAEDYTFVRRDIMLENIKSIELVSDRTHLTYTDIDGEEKVLVLEARAMQILPEIIPEYFK